MAVKPPDTSTAVNPHHDRTCPEHKERVDVPLGKGWRRCPIDECVYTRR